MAETFLPPECWHRDVEAKLRESAQKFGRDALAVLQRDGLRTAEGILGTAIHHEETHEELRVANQHLQFVIGSSPVVMFTCDPARGLATTWISANVDATFGVPAAVF